MKPVITLALLLFCSACLLQAQITNPRLTPKTTEIKKDTVKIETLKTTAPHTYVKKPPPLPDLKLSGISFSLVRSEVVDGVTQHTFQINYTVKNEGAVEVAANKVFAQGVIMYSVPNRHSRGGCGSVMTTLSQHVIPPGGSFSGFFRCTAPFDKNNPPLYLLSIDPQNTIKESNDDNNGAQTTILF